MTRGDEGAAEVGRRIHAWLERERKDALGDLGIARPSSPLLAELVGLLRKTFPPKSAK